MHAMILMEYADMAENIGPQEVQAEKCVTGVDVLAILEKSFHFVSIKLAKHQVVDHDSSCWTTCEVLSTIDFINMIFNNNLIY